MATYDGVRIKDFTQIANIPFMIFRYGGTSQNARTIYSLNSSANTNYNIHITPFRDNYIWCLYINHYTIESGEYGSSVNKITIAFGNTTLVYEFNVGDTEGSTTIKTKPDTSIFEYVNDAPTNYVNNNINFPWQDTGDTEDYSINTDSKDAVLNSQTFYYITDPSLTGSNIGANNITITYSVTSEETTTYKVTSTLTNCTLTPTDTEIAEGTETTFTVTANDGYTFNTVPTINGTAMTKTLDTIYTSTITVNSDVAIVASADKVAVTYTVTRDLNYCTISPDTTVLNEGVSYTFTITAETGYEFSRSDYVTITGGAFSISEDKLSATATITATQDITIVAHALIVQTHKIYITGTLTNCTCNYNTGDDLTENKAVTFTANEGYYFYNLTPEYEVKRSVPTNITTVTGALNGGGTQTLIDATQVNLYINNETNITIISDITAIVQPSEIINGINVYNISESILQQLMQVRFTLGTESSGTETIDYGKWITNLYYLPFDVSQYINAENADIILGNKNTSLHSNLLKSYFDIDLGSITIPEFSNSYESENAIIRLYLPFIDDIIVIDNMYSGKSISIKYHIDLLEETITLIIISEETPIMYDKYSIGRNLPFFSTENGNTNLHYSNDTKNTVLTAFIIVSKNNYSQVLGEIKGSLIQMNYINNFETSATQEEQEEVINLLSQGVIVK